MNRWQRSRSIKKKRFSEQEHASFIQKERPPLWIKPRLISHFAVKPLISNVLSRSLCLVPNAKKKTHPQNWGAANTNHIGKIEANRETKTHFDVGHTWPSLHTPPEYRMKNVKKVYEITFLPHVFIVNERRTRQVCTDTVPTKLVYIIVNTKWDTQCKLYTDEVKFVFFFSFFFKFGTTRHSQPDSVGLPTLFFFFVHCLWFARLDTS